MPGPLVARKLRLQAQVQPDTVPRPTVTGCTGALAGGTVTITGRDFWYPNSNLHQYHAYAVRFGNQETGANGTNVVVTSATALTCTVPAGLTGTVSVRVWSPGGSNVGDGLFSYTTAVGASPNPANGGDTVTVTGTGLDGATTWGIGGGIGGNVTSANGTTVQFTLPNGIVDGNYTLNVAVPGGNVSVGSTSSFLVNNTPHPLAVSPNSGYTAGGTAITITGENLQSVTGGTLGGVALTSVVAVDSQHVTAVTGAHAAGAVDLTLTNAVGSGTLTNAYTYVQWTPAVSDPTGWWEDYGAASWSSLASAGTSGSAPALTNPGSYPGKGTPLNGHDVVKFNGRTLVTSSITPLLTSSGPNCIVMLVKVPAATVVAASAGGACASPRLATDNTFRWSFACGGNNGGGSGAGPVAWMMYNADSGGAENDPIGSVAAMTADAYHLLICEWDDTGVTKGMTTTVQDLGVSSTASKPANTHFNGFGPKVAGDANLAFDLATNLILGGRDEGATGSDGTECNNIEVAMVLTFKHKITTDTTAALLLDYVQRKFGVP